MIPGAILWLFVAICVLYWLGPKPLKARMKAMGLWLAEMGHRPKREREPEPEYLYEEPDTEELWLPWLK